MKITQKPWGESIQLHWNIFYSIFRCTINPGGKSSNGRFHIHRHRSNAFFIERGVLDLFVRTDEQFHNIILNPETRRTYTVLPGVSHRFENNSEDQVIVYEVYTTIRNNDNDIIRERA